MHWWRGAVCVVLIACGGKIAAEDTFGSGSGGDTNGKKKASSGYVGGDDDDDTLPKKGSTSGYTSSGYPYPSSSSGYYGTSGYSSGDPYPGYDSGYYPPPYDAGPPPYPYPYDGGYSSSSSSSSGTIPYCPAAKVSCGAYSGGSSVFSCTVTDGFTSMTCSYGLGQKVGKCSCGGTHGDPGKSFPIDAADIGADVFLKYWIGNCGGSCY